MFLISVVFILLYSALMVGLLLGWNRATVLTRPNEEKSPHRRLTVIIPFRNEEENLELLFATIERQNGGLEGLRLICVDDHSSDRSAEIVRKFARSGLDIQLMKSAGKGKMAALNTGRKAVATQYLLTLDADVQVGENWLESVFDGMDRGGDMIILPVRGVPGPSFLSTLATLDFMALIGVTFSTAALGHATMANGAHLLYRTEGHMWDEKKVSGDDVFSLHEIKRNRGRVNWDKRRELIVDTPMPENLSEFLQQRKRWASKSKEYRDKDTLILGWIILLLNVWVWVLFVSSFGSSKALYLFLAVVSVKAILDFMFLREVLDWSDQRRLLWCFPFAFLFNSLILPVVFVLNLVSGFKWKERSYS